MKRYVVSLSSGASSAVAAQRTIDRYGRENVDLVFMNVKHEHRDNYRFLRDLRARWGEIIILKDGRTPENVWDDRQLIPNSLMCPCTFDLKIRLFVNYCKDLQAQGYKVIAVIGYNYRDSLPRPKKPHGRLPDPVRNYGKLGIVVKYPLLWRGDICRNPHQVVESWGLKLPEMYHKGFLSANCSGDCPKGGISHWRRVLREYPNVYAHREAWETNKRKNPKFSAYTILKRQVDGITVPLSLQQLREETEIQLMRLHLETVNLIVDEETKIKLVNQLIENQWRRWLLEDDLQGDSCTQNECGVGSFQYNLF